MRHEKINKKKSFKIIFIILCFIPYIMRTHAYVFKLYKIINTYILLDISAMSQTASARFQVS